MFSKLQTETQGRQITFKHEGAATINDLEL